MIFFPCTPLFKPVVRALPTQQYEVTPFELDAFVPQNRDTRSNRGKVTQLAYHIGTGLLHHLILTAPRSSDGSGALTTGKSSRLFFRSFSKGLANSFFSSCGTDKYYVVMAPLLSSALRSGSFLSVSYKYIQFFCIHTVRTLAKRSHPQPGALPIANHTTCFTFYLVLWHKIFPFFSFFFCST